MEGDSRRWRPTASEVLATAGSRYTYSANTLAYAEAVAGGAREARPRGDELPVVGRPR